MATLTTQSISRSGLTTSFTSAAGGGDSFTPDGQTLLRVKNASGSIITITVVSPGSVIEGVTKGDVTFTVPATTGDVIAGPFPAEHFADPTDGLADITYSGVTSLTVAALRVSQP